MAPPYNDDQKKEHCLLLIYPELGARVELLKDAQFCHAGSSKK
jgi:hypothetical protein